MNKTPLFGLLIPLLKLSSVFLSCEVVIGLFIMAHLLVAVFRIDVWPFSTFSMFADYDPRKVVGLIRPAYLLNGEIFLFPQPVTNKWETTKYSRLLRTSDETAINGYLIADCKRHLNDCEKRHLVLVLRRLIAGEKYKVEEQIVYRMKR